MKIKKNKIMHIMQSAGGVAEYVKELLDNNKNSYENVLVVSNDYKNNKEIREKCNKYYFVDMVREISIIKDLKAVFAVRKIIKKEKPDIVYLHSSKAGAIGRIALWFNKKVKIIYNAHGWYFNADIGKKKIIFQIIEKILAIKTDKIVAISNSEYESALKKNICKKDKLVLISNGIDFNKFKDNYDYRKSTRKKYNINENDIVVGIVGRISEQKDPLTTIKAAYKIIKECDNIYFMFVGSGDLEENIKKISQEAQIDSHVIITGWVNDVEKYIPAFDIALLPSKWEGFGLAITEYIACKKPIIATNVGGIADILSEHIKGFLIEKEDYNGIVRNINYILENKKQVKETVEKNYIEARKKFSIENEILLTNKLIENLINE